MMNVFDIIIIVLLLIIVALLGIGDLILAFLAGMELRPTKKKQDDDDDEIQFLETAPGQTGMRVPISRIPEVFGTLIQKAKEQNAMPPVPGDEEKKEIDKNKPAGYL